jgi:hypothetical protein
MTAPVTTSPADEPAAEAAVEPPPPPQPAPQDDTPSRPTSLPTTPTRVGDSTTPPATTPVGPPPPPGTSPSTQPSPSTPGTTSPSTPGTPAAASAAPRTAPPVPGPAPAPKTDPKDTANPAAKTDGKTDGKADPKTDGKTDGKTDAKADDAKPAPADAGLASLGSLTGPLLNTALGVPAAALQGAGQLMPGLAGAVMPTLAALLSQLGTGTTPAAPTSRITGYPNTVAGPLSGLAGTGAAADAARAKSAAMAREVAALREVEQKLGDVLGLSSAKTEAARATLIGIIREVETAVRAASVQGDTPEARAAVLTAMRQALANAGTVVDSSVRDKMTDAQFVRQLIATYLGRATPTGGAPAFLMAGSSGRRGGPYGLPRGTAINYGGKGFPPWVYDYARRFNIQASTYAGHQERGPGGLNRGIDWAGRPQDLQRFATFLATTGLADQVIYMNPETGQKTGYAAGYGRVGPGTAYPDYYRTDWLGHRDHIHSSFSRGLR